MVVIKEGDKYNRLKFISRSDIKNNSNRKMGIFICDCGTECIKPIGRVVSGTIKSCGCLTHDTKPNLSHGMKYTKEYSTWASAKNRVTNPNNKDYKEYSKLENDKTIDTFEAFYKEMGNCPGPEYSIDRIKNNIGYKKGNIRWATRSQQQKNKYDSYKVVIKGIEFDSPTDAAIHFKVSLQTINKWCFGWIDKRVNKIWEKKEWAKVTKKYPEQYKERMIGKNVG